MLNLTINLQLLHSATPKRVTVRAPSSLALPILSAKTRYISIILKHEQCGYSKQCDCERNYDWIRVPEPLTLEGIKARKGCGRMLFPLHSNSYLNFTIFRKPLFSAESWCNKYTCKAPSKCRDTAPGIGKCYCPEGYEDDPDIACVGMI